MIHVPAIAQLCQRDLSSGGNLPVAFWIDLTDGDTYLDVVDPNVKLSAKKHRPYGELPVCHEQFYAEIFKDPEYTALVSQVCSVRTRYDFFRQPMYSFPEEHALISYLSDRASSQVDQAVRIDIGDMRLPYSRIAYRPSRHQRKVGSALPIYTEPSPSLEDVEYIHFPLLREYADYETESLVEALKWWRDCSLPHTVYALEELARQFSDDHMTYLPYDFHAEVVYLKSKAMEITYEF